MADAAERPRQRRRKTVAELLADVPEDAVIVTRRLTKQYGDFTAVDRLNLTIRRGEVFGLLGPNGAGKTTTVLMLLGLTEPTKGIVRVVGLDPAREPLAVKRQVGYLPDNVGFYGGLTGRENLRYTAKLNGIPRSEAEPWIDELLHEVRLEDAGDKKAEQYSRGMRQRLGIADALVKRPTVLILDEPTIAIDPSGVEELLLLLRRLVAERSLTVLLSSHILGQVQSLCDRVGFFAAGRMVAAGPLDELARGAERIVELEVGIEGPAAAIDAVAIAVPGVTSRGSARARRAAPHRHRRYGRGGSARISTGRSRPDPGPPAATGTDLLETLSPLCPGGPRWPPPLTPPRPADTARKARRSERAPSGGWRTIAAKESSRTTWAASASSCSCWWSAWPRSCRCTSSPPTSATPRRTWPGSPALFLALFVVGSQSVGQVTTVAFAALLVPLVGIAFGFDGINSERSQGTLSRLLAQPIHRDDIVNGKFVAGIAVIALMLGALVAVTAGLGIVRLGIIPTARGAGPGVRLAPGHDPVRLVLAGVRAAALGRDPGRRVRGPGRLRDVAGPDPVRPVPPAARGQRPVPGEHHGHRQRLLRLHDGPAVFLRISPATLYQDIVTALMNPATKSVLGVGNLGQYVSAQEQLPSLLSLDQSILLVWPQIVALVAMTTAMFAGAYVLFRQEVRA